MNSFIRAIILLICCICSPAYAQYSAYEIDGAVWAVFPTEPELAGEFSTSEMEVKSYQALDSDSVLNFSLGIHTFSKPIEESRAEDFIRDFVRGEMVVGTTETVDLDFETNSRYTAANYRLHKNVGGVEIQTFNVAILRGNQLVTWSIAETFGISSGDAEQLFMRYKGNVQFSDDLRSQSPENVAEAYVSRVSSGLPHKIRDDLDLVELNFVGNSIVRTYVLWSDVSAADPFKRSMLMLLARDGVLNLRTACTDAELKNLLWSGLTLHEQIFDSEGKLFHESFWHRDMCPY